jgi:GntR family transcriptional regulator
MLPRLRFGASHVFIEVDPASPVPPFEQLRAQFATMIGSGVLRPGDQLPAIRQLAADLGLAVNTVARTYRELEAEGLVRSRVRHGTTVAGFPATARELRQRLDDAAKLYAATAQRLGVPAEDAVAALRRQWERNQ